MSWAVLLKEIKDYEAIVAEELSFANDQILTGKLSSQGLSSGLTEKERPLLLVVGSGLVEAGDATRQYAPA